LDLLSISVVIPALNSESTVRATLEAVLNEKEKPSEIIVVDGGSRDCTVKIAREYPVQILNNPRVHAAAARNIGIQAAKGKIIAFTDSDCLPETTWLERILDHFESNSSLIGVGGIMLPRVPENKIEEFSGSVFLNEIMKFPNSKFIPDKKHLTASFITANCAYDREALISIGGFNEFFKNHGEDVDLFWRMLSKYPLMLLYDPSIIIYHKFPKSYSGLARKYIQYGIASSKLNKKHLKLFNIDFIIYKKLLRHIFYILIPWKNDKIIDFAYVIQLSSHISGKVYGSFLTKTINL
jgi:glycosyltransferase involved in cell wall biosynthesis